MGQKRNRPYEKEDLKRKLGLEFIRYAPRGLPELGPLLSRPEKKDMSFSLSIFPASCVDAGGELGSLERFASRSYV
jgi:hypothetical protein